MGEHGYGRGMLLAAGLMALAAPAVAAAAAAPVERRRRGTSLGKSVPVDRSYRMDKGHANSGSLSKLLAAGRRTGRI